MMYSVCRNMLVTFILSVCPVAFASSADETTNRKPIKKATAEEFVKEAVTDPEVAETALKGKVVELTGQVSTADPTYSGWGITLSAGKLKPSDAFSVSAECEVPQDQREKVWLLGVGQKVKVVGQVKLVDKNRVRLTDCEVTELEPNPIPSARSTEVAAAYGRNEEEASKKYGDRNNMKELFLEGVVKSTKQAQYGTIVSLNGSGKIGIHVQVPNKEAEGLKSGAKLRLKTSCRGLWPEESAVLFFGHVIPGEKDQ